jgi:hypothetical protein
VGSLLEDEKDILVGAVCLGGWKVRRVQIEARFMTPCICINKPCSMQEEHCRAF